MELFVDITNLLVTVSSLSSILNSSIQKHNLRVSFLAFSIANKISYSVEFLRNVAVAGLLHDIGILFFNSREQAELLLKESGLSKESEKIIHLHAYVGYELLRHYPLFSKVARIIKHHHRTFNEYVEAKGKIPLSSQLILLADRIDVYMSNRIESGVSISKAVESLKKKISAGRGSILHPRLVDIFLNHLADKEALWFELYAEPSYLEENISKLLSSLNFRLSQREFLKVINLFGYIIDFKSEFTATHSSGVAQTAVQLASMFSFSQSELKKMRIAGLLHDIGKIVIPSEVLEKPDRLTEEEFDLMKSHVFHTYKLLLRFVSDSNILEWASYHHEKLNGKGYPFKLRANQIPMGSRILAVADVFTALTEERPYKKGMTVREVLNILKKMAENRELDYRVVNVLEEKVDIINRGRQIAQEKARKFYEKLKEKALQFS
ncbi:HDIG domain-containing protein [Desulfurobacterium pacificum]|uniref:HDIG domain-containing protein n=1 Tax=Desulfurobacterium pacificum TaxID=240166 RepID=A0ABY1NVX1_9BACT|nr:HD domain-containing phosphohydrolase [Desulfurobacterium pacificum]SMP19023.1 HDIG domain-containing protein [Desulfurobacterium pacificum]